jgi:two-component system response regulator VicR
VKKKILIIEDDKDTSEMLGYFADELNFEVLTAAGIVSLSVIEALSPDLILLDHWLGDSFGGNLCLEIKGHPPTWHIPVIMVSGQSNLHIIARACCADGFIEKPFDLKYLQKIMMKFVDAIAISPAAR